MLRLLVITPLILLPVPAFAEDAGEAARVAYVLPRIPGEMEKKAALMLGYQLNGDSMVRNGSIDVTGMITPLSVPTDKIVPDTLKPEDKNLKPKDKRK